MKTFGAEEQEHVDALTATIKDLGGTPVKAPEVDFGDAFTSAEKLIPLAITFEDIGVSAYNGAAPRSSRRTLLATAGGIVQVEARHAATIRFAAGEDPAPEAFDPTLTRTRSSRPCSRTSSPEVMTRPWTALALRRDLRGPRGHRGLRRRRGRAGGGVGERRDHDRRLRRRRSAVDRRDRDRRLQVRPGDDRGRGRHRGHLDELRRRAAHGDRRRRLVRHRRPRQGRLARASPSTSPGSFSYYCRFHPFMKATVEVQ